MRIVAAFIAGALVGFSTAVILETFMRITAPDSLEEVLQRDGL